MSQLLLQSALYVQTNQLGCLGDPHDTPILPRVLLVSRSIFHSSLPPFYLRHDPAYETGLDDFVLAERTNSQVRFVTPITATTNNPFSGNFNIYQTDQIWKIDEKKRARNLRGILQVVALSSTVQFTPRLTLLHPLVDFRTFDILFRRALFFPYFCRTVSRFESHFITDENAHMVGKMIGLKSLVINGENQDRCIPTPHRLTFAGLKSFRGLVELRELRLEKCRHIQTDVISIREEMKDEQEKNKTVEDGLGCLFGGDDQCCVADVSAQSNVAREELGILRAPLISDITKDMRHLKILSLCGTNTIVPESLEGICESNPGLQQIDLSFTGMATRFPPSSADLNREDCWGFLRPSLLRQDGRGLAQLDLSTAHYGRRSGGASTLWSVNWRNMWGLDEKDDTGSNIYDTQAVYDLRSFKGELCFSAFRDLEPFQQCPYLEFLHLSMVEKSTIDSRLPRCCSTIFEPLFNTSLKRLHLHRIDVELPVSTHFVELMNHVGSQLEELTLSDCMVSNSVVKALADSKMKRGAADLELLNLSYNPLLTSIILRWIGENEPMSKSLHELDLCRCASLFVHIDTTKSDDDNANDVLESARDGAKQDDYVFLASCAALKKINMYIANLPSEGIEFLDRRDIFGCLEVFYH